MGDGILWQRAGRMLNLFDNARINGSRICDRRRWPHWKAQLAWFLYHGLSSVLTLRSAPMEHTQTSGPRDERHAVEDRRVFAQRTPVVTICRALSIISGGCLLATNLGWPVVGGAVIGLVSFALVEGSIRR
jgi:hypothetical protein